MQTLFVHSAFWRGVSLFAGMLMGKVLLDRPGDVETEGAGLVSWSPGARSRREDEFARSQRE